MAKDLSDDEIRKYREDLITYILNLWFPSKRVTDLAVGGKTRKYEYLIAINAKNEGLFLILDETGYPGVLTREVYRAIVQESIISKLANRLHVYAELVDYAGAGVEFHQVSTL